jgi:hypothetical protein
MNNARETKGTVLLVEADAEQRERFGSWLEDEGFRVLACPGPTEPDYTCIGGRTGACPLAAEASAVVLDMSLDSEALLMGTAAEELLGLYLMSGHRVLVLEAHPGEEIGGWLLRRRRHLERDEFLRAVRSLASLGRPSETEEGPHAQPGARRGPEHLPL